MEVWLAPGPSSREAYRPMCWRLVFRPVSGAGWRPQTDDIIAHQTIAGSPSPLGTSPGRERAELCARSIRDELAFYCWAQLDGFGSGVFSTDRPAERRFGQRHGGHSFGPQAPENRAG